MKKILMLLAALIAVTVFSQGVCGAEKTAEVYISKDIKNKIESNLYNDLPVYTAMFGTEDISFNFNKAVPVYSFDNAGSPNHLSEALLFTGQYKVPVYDRPAYDPYRKCIGMADFGQVETVDKLPQPLKNDPKYIEDSSRHAGKWQVRCFSDGEFEKVLYDQIAAAANSAKIDKYTYDKVYYVENLSIGDGLVFFSDKYPDKEIFMNISEIPYSKDGEYRLNSKNLKNKVYLSGTQVLRQELELTKSSGKSFKAEYFNDKYADKVSDIIVYGKTDTWEEIELRNDWDSAVRELDIATSNRPIPTSEEQAYAAFNGMTEMDGIMCPMYSVNAAGRNIGSGKTAYFPVELTMSARDNFYLKLGITPSASSGYVEIGIKASIDGKSQHIPMANIKNDLADMYYPVIKSGEYKIYVKNYTDQTVSVRGYIIPINYNASAEAAPYSQDKKNWNWAACIQTVGSAFGSKHSQEDIVTSVLGSAKDTAGQDSYYQAAVSYATDKRCTASVSNKLLTIERMHFALSDGRPIIIGWGKYNSKGERYAENSAVITEVDMLNDVDIVKMICPRYNAKPSIKHYRYAQLTASPAIKYDKTISVIYADN